MAINIAVADSTRLCRATRRFHLRTEMEAGLARQRRRFTDVPTKVSVRWIMRRDQYAILKAGIVGMPVRGKLVCDHASGRSWPIGARGTLYTAVFITAFWRVGRFGKLPPSWKSRERPVLDEGLLNLLLSEDAQGIITVGDGLHILVHQTLPLRPLLTTQTKEDIMTLQTDLRDAVARVQTDSQLLHYRPWRRSNNRDHQWRERQSAAKAIKDMEGYHSGGANRPGASADQLNEAVSQTETYRDETQSLAQSALQTANA